MKNYMRKTLYFLGVFAFFLIALGLQVTVKAASVEPSGSVEPGSEPSVEPSAPKVGIRFIENNGDELLMFSKFARVTDENGNVVTEAAEGDLLWIERLFPKDEIYKASSVYLYVDSTGTGSARYPFSSYYFMNDNDNRCSFIMHSETTIIEVKTNLDPVLESSSIEASESESASISESESISQSIEFEQNACPYGNYVILYDLSETEPPMDGFVLANDTTTFDKKVKAYYSTTYRMFVYYAEEKGGTPGFYVLNPMDETLTPFVTVTDSEGNVFIPSGAPSITAIPGVYKANVFMDVSPKKDNTAHAPGFIITDQTGEQLILLYLNSADGKRDFYVYENSGDSPKITRFIDYEGEKGISIEETEEEIPTKPATDDDEGILNNSFIWFLIIGIIIAIIAAALILVFIISKKQEKEEAELNEDDEESEDGEDFDDFREFRDHDEVVNAPQTPVETEDDVPFDASSYSNSSSMDSNIDSEPFNVDFENAFPDEVSTGIATAVAPETPAEPEVSQVFDFTFDFKASDAEKSTGDIVSDTGYVEVKIPETRKPVKEKLSEEDFTEINFKNEN